MYWRIALVLALSVTLPSIVWALPPNDGFVTQEFDVLTAQEEQSLENLLKSFRKRTDKSIVILARPYLKESEQESIVDEIIESWDLTTDPAVIIVYGYHDRYIYSMSNALLEAELTPEMLRGIESTDILPAFRDGDYYRGFTDGVSAVEKHVRGEYSVDRYAQEERSSSFLSGYYVILFIICLQIFGLWHLTGKKKIQGAGIAVLCFLILTANYSIWLNLPGVGMLVYVLRSKQ